MNNENLGLYIHIPFCRTKCPYCNFYSVCSSDKSKFDAYSKQLINEIKKWSKILYKTVDSIYFGGGTPPILGSNNIYNLILAVKTYFKVSSDCEITMEANPNSLDDFDLCKVQDIGLNRVSLGVQSINEDELQLLGRKHSQNNIKTALDLITESGINNISADLMIGIQKQSILSLKRSLDFLLDNNVKHISAYMLKIEKNTVYYKKRNELMLPTDDEEYEMYLFLCNYLKQHNIFQYEISNFSVKGFDSRHNNKYWTCEDYLGLGASAHSYINSNRFFTANNLTEFLKNPTYIDERSLTPFNMQTCYNDNRSFTDEDIEEYIMLRLRCTDGLKFGEFYNRFGFGVPQKYIINAEHFKNTDLVAVDENKISLSEKGFLVSNILISEILYGNN